MQERIGERLVVVGTAHISPKSVDEVRRTIETERPEVVCIELDALRLDALENRRRWEETPIHRLLKSNRLWVFLLQVLLGSYQRRMGAKLGVRPGDDMLEAVRGARRLDADVDLSDRDVAVTMRRALARMKFREKLRLLWEFSKAIVGGEEEDELDVDEMLEEDVLTQLMRDLAKMAPSIHEVVIDERDTYLAERIRRRVAEGKRVVAVVGAGHLAGIRERLNSDAPPPNLEPLETVPVRRALVAKTIGYGVPVLLVLLFAYFGWIGFRDGNWDDLVNSLTALLLWGGGLAAVGAIIARGHPLSVVTAFVVAPFTILHPGLAAGWFSGIVEAWRRTPLVRDFQGLSELDSAKAFFSNRVIRVVMVAALTNVGAMIGAFIAVGNILTRLGIG